MAYSFKLPVITELTIDQISALNDIESISVSGGPGTGKSVVSLWRHIRNYGTKSKKSLLLTYTKTLQHYLSISASSENQDAGEAIDRTYLWLLNPKDYDEIIIDEAQDVNSEVNENLKKFSKKISYGADNQQILDPKRATSEDDLKIIFPTNNYPLNENFRNSYEILMFSKALFPNKLIPQITVNNLFTENRRGNKPIIVNTNNDSSKQERALIEIITLFKSEINSGTHNLAILVPLKKHVLQFHELINKLNLGVNHTFYCDGEDFNGIENLHITTFKSAKGLEFDTVIIPDFQNYDWNIVNLTQAPITENDYFVGITRARRNLYLISSTILPRLKGEINELTYSIEQYQ